MTAKTSAGNSNNSFETLLYLVWSSNNIATYRQQLIGLTHLHNLLYTSFCYTVNNWYKYYIKNKHITNKNDRNLPYCFPT